MKGVLFSNLDDIVINKDLISNRESLDKWHIIPYKCGKISGRMLTSGECSHPEDIRLSIGLSGWYKVFIGTVNMKSKNLFDLRFSSDEGFYAMSSPTMESKFAWSSVEYFEEFLWICKDLTGEELILRKPDCMQNNACALAFIRCVPMSEDEVKEYLEHRIKAPVHGHFDEDPNAEDTLSDDEGIMTRYSQLTLGDLNEMSLEFSFDYDTADEALPTILKQDTAWEKGDRSFNKIKEYAYKKRVDHLHKNGIKAYAANRMSVCEFFAPYSNPYWTSKKFVKDNPGFYCKTRVGETVKVCSYAYKEVRRYVIENFVEMMKYGFDGVTLILHRGLHVGFEAPVIQRFNELYPNIDPHTLPVTDDRLNGVFCSFMTEFMKELREALDSLGNKKLTVNVITDYTPDTSKHFGLDVAEWARLGLVDRVMQGIMEVYEDFDGVLDENGVIDLEKYKSKLETEPIIRRYHNTSLEKTVEGTKKYLEILKGTDVKYSAALPWPHRCNYSEIENYKNTVMRAGAKEFLLWNANHTLLDVAEMHAILGRTEEFYTVNRYRTLSIDGVDMSEFNPNWRG